MDSRQLAGLLGTLLLKPENNSNADILNQIALLGLLKPNTSNENLGILNQSNSIEARVPAQNNNARLTNFDSIVNAIGKYESGNNYKSVGVRTNSGDRAYGKYQIMGANIPSWSREALGKEVSIPEFLGNEQIQDQIARYKMAQYLKQYGNIHDVASMWFSGRPAKNNYSRDALGTSVPEYIANVNKLYNA